MLKQLENLFHLARERKKTPIEGSYTNKLLANKNLSKSKVLEEIHELIEAVEQNSNKIHEAADVLYHLARKEITCNKIYEDEFVLSFYDINPQKKIHVLVIPKGKYVDFDDFANNASPAEIVGMIKGINSVAKKLGISVDTGAGYRALTNISENGGQEVPHLHFHLFGGEKIGKMVE